MNRFRPGTGLFRTLCMMICILLLSSPAECDNGFLQEGTVLVLVYASGGDLEADYGLITEDIGQILSGSEGSSPDTVEVVVAYGGSARPGWNGMKIANLSLLRQDLADGELGNQSYCLTAFPDASMGSADTLGEFLLFARDRFRYDRVFLILIGHGEAYTGMLFDQNHGNDPLTLPELVSGLQRGGFNVELAGFDTCLMGSLETASRMSGYARYMIASEESEPAEGWQYDQFISSLVRDPRANITLIGNQVITGYLQGNGSGRTLSLLDLEQAGVVTAELDRYADDLLPLLNTPEGYHSLEQAFFSSQQFGLTGNGTLDPATMDLADVVKQTSMADPLLKEPADTLLQAIGRMVIRSGHDEFAPRANGLAILSPVQINSRFYEYYRDEVKITPSWDQFMKRYLEVSDEEKSRTGGEMPELLPWT